jgi:membrane fusion protein (multidrug efflux system)
MKLRDTMNWENLTNSGSKTGIIKILAAVTCGFFLLLFIWFFWPTSKDYRDAFKPPVIVEAETVIEGPISRRVNTNGVLTAAQSVALYPEIEGRISKIYFKQGEFVNKGDLLLSLNDSTYRARVQEEKAKLSLANSEYNRAKQLYDRNFGAKAVVEKAEASVEMAEAGLKVAEVHLEQTLIKAPFDGIVGLQYFSEGATVARNQEILTLVDAESLYVDFPVPDSFLRNLKKGDIVDITVDDSLPVESEIIAIDPKADPVTHSIQVRSTLANPEGQLKPGQFARVTLELGQEDNATLIPFIAVEKEGDSNFVYIVVDGIAVLTEVSLGLREGGVVQVKEGLKKGDVVITAGQMKVVDGSPVRIAVKDAEVKNPEAKVSEPTQKKSWVSRLFH